MNKILVFVLFLITMGVQAQTNDFKPVNNRTEVEDKLLAASGELHTITCDFVQKKHLEYLSAVIESNGQFWFEKPGRLRWEYMDPFKYIVLINNGMFTVVDEEKTSHFDLKKNAAFRELNAIISSSVDGTLIESDKFNVDILENKDYYLVQLDPRNEQMKDILNKIELYFSKLDLNVEKTRMIETAEDYTEIIFKNRQYNVAVGDEVFRAAK